MHSADPVRYVEQAQVSLEAVRSELRAEIPQPLR